MKLAAIAGPWAVIASAVSGASSPCERPRRRAACARLLAVVRDAGAAPERRAFAATVLAGDVGDHVRVMPRGSTAVVEASGPDRLAEGASAPREARSGLLVVRTTPVDLDELASLAQAVAQRYFAAAHSTVDGETIEFGCGAALLTLVPAAIEPAHAAAASALLHVPGAAAVRLTVTARADRLDAALDAERALMRCAAMLSSAAASIAIDDTGAIFSAEVVDGLGTRNQTRADAFAFAAAALRRACPPAPVWFSRRTGVCDELVVFSSRPQHGDVAAQLLTRELSALAEAACFNEDPVLPGDGELCAGDGASEPAGPRPLATLNYETVAIDIGLCDAASIARDMRERFEARREVAELLGAPVASAIVIAFGNRGDDTASERFALEMRRAETLATTLAAAFAAHGGALGADVRGTLYDAGELLELARRRSGKSRSWSARVAELERARTAAEAG